MGLSLRRAFIFLALFGAKAVYCVEPSLTQSDLPLEYKVKAAYVFNFARFVEWPAGAFDNPESPIVIGIVGYDSFASSLKSAFKELTVEGRPLVVKEILFTDQLPATHILYIAQSEDGNVASYLSRMKKSPTLTISEAGRFIQQGGIIQLGLRKRKVIFTVNLPRAEQAGLKISSQMLQYAENNK